MAKDSVIFESLYETEAKLNYENTLEITQYFSDGESSTIYIPRQYVDDFIGRLIDLHDPSTADTLSSIIDSDSRILQ